MSLYTNSYHYQHYIALKQFATLSTLDVNALVRINHGSYTSSEITDMEMNILNILDWHICDVTACSVSFTLIGLLSKTSPRIRNAYHQ